MRSCHLRDRRTQRELSYGRDAIACRRGREEEQLTHVPVGLLDVGLVPQQTTGVPFTLARHVAAESELHDEARYHAEEAATVEEARLHQLTEARGSYWRLLLSDRDCKAARAAALDVDVEPHSEVLGGS